jgi:hypothetical protein
MGRRTSIGRPSGANTNYVYDNAGRLASLGHDFPDNSYDLTLSYTHNPAGQIASRTSSNPGSSPGQAHVYSYGAVSNGAASSTVNGLTARYHLEGPGASSNADLLIGGVKALLEGALGNITVSANFVPDPSGIIFRISANAGTGLNHQINAGGAYVLVRNGVIAPSGSSLLDVHTRNSAVSLRHFFWRPVDGMFSIINFQVSRGSRQVYNVPLIVRTSRKVERAQAFCDFHH